MKRLLTGRAGLAALVGIVMLLIGGGYALASGGGNTINACVKKQGGALYKAKKCHKGDSKISWNKQGPRGKTGRPGPAGAQGAPGAAGAPGASGFVQSASWSGQIGNIDAGPASTFVFAGPQATISTTAGQLVNASGSVALATKTTGTSSEVEVSICTQVATGGAVTPLAGDVNNDFQDVTVLSTRLTYAGSWAGTPGAGSWKIGMCVRNEGKQAINNPDWSVGFAFVTNGASSSASAASSDAGRQALHTN